MGFFDVVFEGYLDVWVCLVLWKGREGEKILMLFSFSRVLK